MCIIYIYYIIYVYEFARRRNGKIKIVIKNRYVYTCYNTQSYMIIIIIYILFFHYGQWACTILYVLYYYNTYYANDYLPPRQLTSSPKVICYDDIVGIVRTSYSYMHKLYIYTRDIIIIYRIIGLTICHYIYCRTVVLLICGCRALASTWRTRHRYIYIIINIYKHGVYAMHYYAYNCKNDRREKNTSLFSRCIITKREWRKKNSTRVRLGVIILLLQVYIIMYRY